MTTFNLTQLQRMLMAVCFLLPLAAFAQLDGGEVVENGRFDNIAELVERVEYMVPMPDGARLATDVYRPILQDDLAFEVALGGEPILIRLAKKGTQIMRFPEQEDPKQLSVIMTRTPYNKKDPGQGQAIALMGYMCIVQDNRGRYASEGTYIPLWSDGWAQSPYIDFGHPLDITPNKEANDHEDGKHAIEWVMNDLRYDSNGDGQVTAQDNLMYNGNIGMFGASALGYSQTQAAGAMKINTSQPGLKCLMPIVSPCEWYQGVVVKNGSFRRQLVEGWQRGQVERYSRFNNSVPDGSTTNGIHSFEDYGGLDSLEAAREAVNFVSVYNRAHTPKAPMRTAMDMSLSMVDENGNGDPNGTISRYTNMDLPIFNVVGWWDIFIDSQLQSWAFSREHLRGPNRDLQKIIIGPWAHQTISSRSTGDMRDLSDEGGRDFRYPENATDIIGINTENFDISNLSSIGESDVLAWYRKFLGEPSVWLEADDEWQQWGSNPALNLLVGAPLGANIEVQLPAEEFVIPFADFFNFINGAGPLNNLPVRWREIGSDEEGSLANVNVPNLGISFLGDDSNTPFPNIADKDFASVPHVRFYLTGPVNDGIAANENVGNFWVGWDTFPNPAETVAEKFYLHKNGMVDQNPPVGDEGTRSFIANPYNPCPTHGGPNMITETPDGDRSSQGQMDFMDPMYSGQVLKRPLGYFQGEQHPEILEFETPAFEAPYAVAGIPTMSFYASSTPEGTIAVDSTNAEFHVRVLDVYPDGRELYVFEGTVNARAREYAAHWARTGREDINIPYKNIPSNEMLEYHFQMYPIGYVWGQGHKMKVLISGSNSPRFEPCANLPLEDGDFFYRVNLFADTYTYNGQTLYARQAKNTIAFAEDKPAWIEFPRYSESVTFAERPIGGENSLPITLFPNPSSTVATLQAEQAANYTVNVYDLQGRMVYTAPFTQQLEINVTDLTPGTYIAQVRSTESRSTWSEKLIVR